MAPRNRYSEAPSLASRPSTVSSPRRDATNGLPPYKNPSFPLDSEATKALRELQGKSLDSVKKHAKQSVATVTKAAEIINDVLSEHAHYLERRQKKWNAGKNLDSREEEERTMAELQQAVDQATAKLEESMRAVIDSGIAAQRIDKTLDWLRQHAPKELEDEYHTQMTQRASQRQLQTASQLRSQHGNNDDDDDEEAMDVDLPENPTPGPTPLDGPRPALTGASQLFTTRMQRDKDAYMALSMTARYARNNDYRDFKGIVHSARHGEASTVSHEDTWFTEAGLPTHESADSTQRRGGASALESDIHNDNDDDDIIVDKATTSTRCPLTYQQFRDPYTSTKCPHTFEKTAILEMIRGSVNKISVRGSSTRLERAVECPVHGCSQLLTVHDLRTDPVLVRKIQRIIKAETDMAEESSEDEDEEEMGNEAVTSSSARVQVASTQHTIVEDLGDPTDSEEEV